MPLAPGSRIGSYEVVALVGQGGMGAVYLSKDLRLHRDVALKILPDGFAADRDRLARFEREAQVLASLNHPNVAQIYGIEDQGDVRALVMEFVPGHTLAHELASRAHGLPVDDVLPIARQIADGLEAAHERGIVHRDLKPGNVMRTADDRVKILDFGLARVAEPDGGGADPSNSPTMTLGTHAGMILGTASYMSPEQAKGRPADKRSDIWSFGCVLYEMLTGARAYPGETVSETIANVLKSDPDWSCLPPRLPKAVRLCLERCLVRDRNERIGDISTVKFLLSQPLAFEAAGQTAGSDRSRPKPLLWTAVTVALAAAAAITAWSVKPDAGARAITSRFQHLLPAGQEFATGTRDAAISDDGTKIVYAANGQLYLRTMSDLEARPIPGTNTDPRDPVFSPEGQWVAYVDRGSGTLKKIALAGGAPVILANAVGGPTDITWGYGLIAFGMNLGGPQGIHAVPEGGGAVKPLASVDGAIEGASNPFLIDATHVLFTLRRIDVPANAGGLSIVVQSIGGSDRKVLVPSASSGRVLPSGRLLYLAGGELRAVAFDVRGLAVTGNSVAQIPGITGFSVARNGTLVYSMTAAPSRLMVWVDRTGKETPLAAPASGYFDVRMSPDGKQIALCNGADIWIWTIATETLARLTLTPNAVEYNPAWTRDGRYVVFDSSDGGARNLQKRAADGTGTATPLAAASGYPESVSPDGKFLVYHTQNNISMLLPLEPVAEARPLLATKRQTYNADISRDGRWITYQSDESGRFEVYVQPFPALEAGRWQISQSGGTQPLWAPSGRELFFIDAAGMLTAVPIQSQTGFSWGKPVPLFRAGQYFVNVARDYDISLDGTRFVFVKPVPSAVRPALTIVSNWFDELNAKLGTR